MTTTDQNGRELRSTITADGFLHLTLDDTAVPDPAPDEVIVRMEAAPINPSDAGLLLGLADLNSLERRSETLAIAAIPPQAMAALQGRVGAALSVGNEGAGTVVRTGADAQILAGRRVAVFGGGMYTRYRTLAAGDCIALPDDVSCVAGAAAYVNPMTALAMLETCRAEGHAAIVHTAAASNLGRMLNRLCQAERIPLVNVVRSADQAELLRGEGAEHVVVSTASDFRAALGDAVARTAATIAFDAVGGGELASDILRAMEAAAVRRQGAAFSRYGTSVHKQVYVYGGLDMRPTVIDRSIGTAWSVGGFLLMTFLVKAGPARERAMRERVLAGLGDVFASHYTETVGLSDLLDPETIRRFARKATGQKVLVDLQR